MAFPQTFDSAEAMQDFAAKFVHELPADCVLALHGDLGAGKTTFTAGLARGLKIGVPVTSPSFNIYSIYESRERQLIHMDAYRLPSPEAFDGLMLEEFIRSPFLWVIEWPEKIEPALPAGTLHLFFKILPDGSREISCGNGHGNSKIKNEE